jgi:ubiquinone/menaquinone biosynthesis C-methylase UbiE
MASRRRPPLESFYDDHPITAEHVLASARERGRGIAAPLSAADLFEFDQDHYGGIGAVDALATRARIGPRSRVLDVCAGLGGPARFLASERGCRVLAVELHPARARGAQRLTTLVGLGDRVHTVRGDATRLPVRSRSCDACISQEALLHIEDKAAVLAECRRALVPGGRLAFTDWIARPRLDDGDRRRLREWMQAAALQTVGGYREMLGRAGFGEIHAEDVSDEWRAILRGRLAAYAGMRREHARQVGDDRHEAFLRVYAFFARLVEAGKLGGGRFVATA